MKGSCLGPQYSDKEILHYLKKQDARFHYSEDFQQLSLLVSKKISEGNVIGWFQDRMEFGPRATCIDMMTDGRLRLPGVRSPGGFRINILSA